MKCKLIIGAIIAILISSQAAIAASPAFQTKLRGLSNHKGPFTFAVLGDNRSGDRVYKKLVKRMISRDPMFVVNTGDIIPHPGNRKQWKNFWENSKPITVPYFLTPGNHDINSVKSQAVWRDEVDLPGNETYYSFNVGKSLFVILNTCEPKDDRRIVGEQLAWLKRTLNPKKYSNQFVFLHHPLFLAKESSHYGGSLDRYPKLRDELHRVFAEKKVDVVFAGHEHTYKRMNEKDGVEYIITGGAGAPLYSGFNHFVIVEVDSKRVKVKVVDRDGYLRDEFYLKGP